MDLIMALLVSTVAAAFAHVPPSALCDLSGAGCEEDAAFGDVSLLQTSLALGLEYGSAGIRGEAAGGHGVSKEARRASAAEKRPHVLSLTSLASRLYSGQSHGSSAQATSDPESEIATLIVLGVLVGAVAAVAICLCLGATGPPSAEKHLFSQEGPVTTKGKFDQRPPMRGQSAAAQAHAAYHGRPAADNITPRPTAGVALLPPTAGRGAATVEMPPAICPSLILPTSEARFMISLDALVQLTRGSLDILGNSGRKLLHAALSDTVDGRRCLMLASVNCEDDPRVSIFTRPRAFAGQTETTLDIFGRYGAPYGTLHAREGFSQLVCEGRPVMTVSPGIDETQLAAALLDGTVLGRGSQKNSGTTTALQGSQCWSVVVSAGVDAVLIMSCMLARILLTPSPGAVSGRPTIDSVRPSMMPTPPFASGRPSVAPSQSWSQQRR